MKYADKIRLCRDINRCPIYQEYSHGVRCNCYRDVHGNERLEVMNLSFHGFLRSPVCNDWEEDYIREWIINATREYNAKYDLD